jgi:hypothetical protein
MPPKSVLLKKVPCFEVLILVPIFDEFLEPKGDLHENILGLSQWLCQFKLITDIKTTKYQ